MKITLLARKDPAAVLPLPAYGAQVPAGFPSPADDYIEGWLDLNEHLVKHPVATFFARAAGTSMQGVGIFDKALLIVDRALTAQNDDIVIASVNGELTCKILDTKAQALRAANPGYAPIPINEGTDCVILGVVTHVVNRLCTHS
jgi:DNA polymerase V